MFHDREDAGKRLAAEVAALNPEDPVVLGLPRGGVIVASPIADALNAPLDVLVVRKLGAPHRPELAIGAVTLDNGTVRLVTNDDVIESLSVTGEELREVTKKEVEAVRLRQQRYRRDRPPVALKGRSVIVVDDGIATGATMLAAVQALRAAEPKRLVLAVAVAPPQAVRMLEPHVDELVCLESPQTFGAVGMFYEDFRQTTDHEVIEALARAGRGSEASSATAPSSSSSDGSSGGAAGGASGGAAGGGGAGGAVWSESMRLRRTPSPSGGASRVIRQSVDTLTDAASDVATRLFVPPQRPHGTPRPLIIEAPARRTR